MEFSGKGVYNMKLRGFRAFNVQIKSGGENHLRRRSGDLKEFRLLTKR